MCALSALSQCHSDTAAVPHCVCVLLQVRTEELGDEWRGLASTEAAHTESIQQALMCCTAALTTPLMAVESEVDAASEAIRALDGGGEWP